jgi:hypothetical protein
LTRTPTSRRKFFIEVRRRGWVVALSVVLVVLVAWGVGKALPPSYSAEAVLVVRAPGPLAEQPNSSTKLAATYATVISLDSSVEATVERALGDSSVSYAASNDPNTAVLRLNVSADTKADAIRGAVAAARSVSGAHPVSKNIGPRTVAVVSLPDSASGTSVSGTTLAVAAVLGALLGFVLLAFWRPRDARVDTVRELRDQVACPCLEVDLGSGAGLGPLFEALTAVVGQSAVVMPCRAKDAKVSDAVYEVLSKPFGETSMMQAGAPGSEDAGELAAVNAGVRILVVGPGTRVAEVRQAADTLERYDVPPSYAVLATNGNGGAAKRADAPDRGGDTPAGVSA